ncbi:hypothetical protein BG004_006420, partial [Podila humilis]
INLVSDIDVYFHEEAPDQEFIHTRAHNRSNSSVSSLSGTSTFSKNSGSDTTGQDQANGPFSRAHPFPINTPAALDDYEFEVWERRKLIPLRIPVLNVVRSWFELYFLEDDKGGKQTLPCVKEFSEANMAHGKLELQRET